MPPKRITTAEEREKAIKEKQVFNRAKVSDGTRARLDSLVAALLAISPDADVLKDLLTSD